MHTHPVLPLLLLAALSMVACDRKPASMPVPTVETILAEPVPVSAAASDPSVPAAESVVTPVTSPAAAGSAAGRSNSPMTAAQESSAMPLPGQANGHSAPLAPAKPASAP
jgi:predicted membrane-bound mannosyltransferase